MNRFYKEIGPFVIFHREGIFPSYDVFCFNLFSFSFFQISEMKALSLSVGSFILFNCIFSFLPSGRINLIGLRLFGKVKESSIDWWFSRLFYSKKMKRHLDECLN